MIKETMEFLSQYDPEVGATIEKEYHREQRNIELIASENIVSPAVAVAARRALPTVRRKGLSASATTAAVTASAAEEICGAPASCSALSMPTSSPLGASANPSAAFKLVLRPWRLPSWA